MAIHSLGSSCCGNACEGLSSTHLGSLGEVVRSYAAELGYVSCQR